MVLCRARGFGLVEHTELMGVVIDLSNRHKHSDAIMDRDQSSRRDSTEDIESRLVSLIVRIGDKTASSLENNIDGLARVLEADFPIQKKAILGTFIECIIERPAKVPIYATLLALLNARKRDIGSEFIVSIRKELTHCLKEKNWGAVRSIVRLLGLLFVTRVITESSFVRLLEDLLSVLSETNVSKRRADSFLTIVLSALPFFAESLFLRQPEFLEKFMSVSSKYFAQRSSIDLEMIRVFSNDTFYQQEEIVLNLWNGIVRLSTSDWKFSLFSFYHNAFEEELNNANAAHEFDIIELPKHSSDLDYLMPRKVFRLFDSNLISQSSGLLESSSTERAILEEIVIDTIVAMERHHRDLSKHLLNLQLSIPCLVRHHLVEIIVGQMFSLPSPSFRQVFYDIVLEDLQKYDTESLEPIISDAAKALFDVLDHMDVECITRFCNWMSHHFSCFDFKWRWSDFESVLNVDDSSVKRIFIQEVLIKTIRLSYYDRIKAAVPEKFQSLLPSPPGTNFLAESMSDASAQKVQKKIMDCLKAKESADALSSILDDMSESAVSSFSLLYSGDVGSVPLSSAEVKVALLIECILSAGSKSLSHVLNLIERYLSLLQNLNSISQARLRTVRTVASFWTKNEQCQVILLDKFLAYRIIDNAAIINWIFSDSIEAHFDRFYIWEILDCALFKLVSRCKQIRGKMQDIEKDIHHLNRRVKLNEPSALEKVKELQLALDNTKSSLSSVQREQKECMLMLFQRFIQLLSNYLIGSTSFPNGWNRWAFGRFREFGRKYFLDISSFIVTLESLLIRPELDYSIRSVFEQVRSLSGLEV